MVKFGIEFVPKEPYWKITYYAIQAFFVCGTPDTCIKRINQLLKSGISQFVVGSPVGPRVRKAIDLISQEIIPSFAM